MILMAAKIPKGDPVPGKPWQPKRIGLIFILNPFPNESLVSPPFWGHVTLVAHAQVPDYVPTEGLVAFYELENSLLDIGEGESHGSSESAQFSCETEDDGFCSLILTEESPYVNLSSSLELNGTQGGISMGGWVKLESMELSNWKLILDVTDGSANNNWGDRIQMGVIQDESGLFWNSGAHFDNDITVDYLLDTPWDIEFGRWYHFMVTYDFDGSLTHYVDGVPVNDTDVSNVGDCFLAGGNNGSRRIGARAHNQDTDLKWEGGLRSIGIWERPLAPSEVEMMFQLSSVQLIGCTDPTACNFSIEANLDDGTCEFGCLYCGEGTVWDSNTSSCIVANPTDTDLDGCTGVGDVLEVLSTFGQCYTDAATIWACGDPMNYHGYDYATVLIGEQCWFAENLRSPTLLKWRYNSGRTESIRMDCIDDAREDHLWLWRHMGLYVEVTMLNRILKIMANYIMAMLSLPSRSVLSTFMFHPSKNGRSFSRRTYLLISRQVPRIHQAGTAQTKVE